MKTLYVLTITEQWQLSHVQPNKTRGPSVPGCIRSTKLLE